MANANGAEIYASQYLSKSEISLSESSTLTIDLNGTGSPCIKPIDAVLAIDSTGSMTTSDPNDARKYAAKEFVGGMDSSKDRVGLVSWNMTATALPLTNIFSEIIAEIDRVGSNGNTSLDAGLGSAISLLPNNDAFKVIVFLTDGVSTDGGHYTPPGIPGSFVDLARKQGIMIFTIGLGQSADGKSLAEIAHATGGEFYPAPDANALAGIYQRIRSTITSIAAENTTVTYVLPSSLAIDLAPYSQSQPVASIKKQGESTILSWYIGSVFINQSRKISFDVSSQDPGTFAMGTPPNTAAIYVNCNGIPESAPIPPVMLKVNLPEPFGLAGSGVGGSNVSVVENISVLKVTKDILPNENAPCPDCPQVKITVETPPKPCNADILFAIDKSGSMRDIAQGKAKKNLEVMKQEVENALTSASNTPELRNANIAIVSWDDEENTNGGDAQTTLNPQWLRIGRSEISSTLENYSNATCSETDLTIYSEGIESAMEIMGKRIIAERNNPLRCDTKRFIIFLTSRSEFKNSPTSTPGKLERILSTIPNNNTLKQGGFQGIFTFYTDSDLSNYPWEYNNLTTIESISGAIDGTRTGPTSLTAENLLSAIGERMKGCDQGLWVNNVTLTDTLYPYLKFNGANPSPTAVTSNRDGSTTLKWNMGTMNPGERWTTTIDTSVQMKLPVDVTKRRTGFGGNISSDTPYSKIEFDWPALQCAETSRRHYEQPLSEGKLWITCGAPCQVTRVATTPTPQQNTTPVNAEVPKKQPGFEGLFGLLALLAVGYLYKEH